MPLMKMVDGHLSMGGPGDDVWVNDDGSIWQPDDALKSMGSPEAIRPDLRAAYTQNQYDKTNKFYSENPQAFSQLGADQAARIRDLSFDHSSGELNAYMDSIRASNPANIHGNGLFSNGNDMWWGPAPGPQHTDSGFGWGSLVIPGMEAGSEYAQSAWNDMRSGLGIMALPFVGAGITAGLGAMGAGAGAAGAGDVALAGGGEVGSGYAASAVPASEAGTIGGSTGSASLVGGAGSDTAAATPADETGAFDMYGSNSGAPGGQPGTVFDYSSPASSYLQQAEDIAKRLGITPAMALQQLLKAAGRAAPAALGAVAANQQANSLSALADKYMGFGAPSRARYEASFAPGFTMANDPGYMDSLNQSSKATLHGLSMQGNPAGSPNAWSQSLADNYAKTAYPALQNLRNTNANAGGIASLQTAAPGAATGAIAAQGNVFNAIGGGINDIFNPKPSLAQTLADYKRLLGTAA